MRPCLHFEVSKDARIFRITRFSMIRSQRPIYSWLFLPVFYSEKRGEKRTKCHFARSKNLTRKSARTRFKSISTLMAVDVTWRVALFGRALSEIGGAGRYISKSIWRKILIWVYQYFVYWNFVILADCFILFLFSFFSSLFYARYARARTFALLFLF